MFNSSFKIFFRKLITGKLFAKPSCFVFLDFGFVHCHAATTLLYVSCDFSVNNATNIEWETCVFTEHRENHRAAQIQVSLLVYLNFSCRVLQATVSPAWVWVDNRYFYWKKKCYLSMSWQRKHSADWQMNRILLDVNRCLLLVSR